MAEFGASATLSVSVPDSEVRSVRQQIEDGIGDVEVGVSASGRSPSAQAQPRDPRTGQFVSSLGPEQFERENLATLDDQVDILEDIRDELEAGAGAGGGGGAAGGILQGLGLSRLLGGGAVAGGAATTAGSGILAGGASIFAGQEAVRKFVPGGKETIKERRNLPQQIRTDPVGGAATTAKQVLDPTGFNEAITRSLVSSVESGLADISVPDVLDGGEGKGGGTLPDATSKGKASGKRIPGSGKLSQSPTNATRNDPLGDNRATGPQKTEVKVDQQVDTNLDVVVEASQGNLQQAFADAFGDQIVKEAADLALREIERNLSLNKSLLGGGF